MQIPVLGKEYYFFDDGKISLSRCYKAKVTGIYPYKEKINVKVFQYKKYIKKKLIAIVKESISKFLAEI